MSVPISTSETAPSAQRASEKASGGNLRARARGGRLKVLGALVFWTVVVSLVGLNAWWSWRNFRPLPDRRKIEAIVRSQRFSEAEPALRELVRRSPEDGAALMLLGRCLAAQGDLVESARVLDRVPFWWPSKGEALFVAGEEYNQAGWARKAEIAWKACAADDPLHPVPEMYYLTAIEALIEIYATQERWEEAREMAWSCLDRVAPDQRINVLFMLLRTRVQRVAAEARAPKLRRFVAADPRDIDSRLALARVEAALGNAEEAERQLTIALEQEPSNVEAWRDRLSTLYERGDMKTLSEAVAKLPKGAVHDGEIWKFRGYAGRSAGDLEDALNSFQRALELRPFDEQIYYQLALAQRQLGRRAEAEKNLARYKEIGEARTKILPAYEAFSNAYSAPSRDPAQIAEASRRLAEICRTLGWSRLAEAVVRSS